MGKWISDNVKIDFVLPKDIEWLCKECERLEAEHNEAYFNYADHISVLAKALGIESEAIDAEHSSLKYKTVMGYISVGRYKRSHIRAFEKGSVLCFITNTALPKYLTIGERQNEGFGAVKICTKEELTSLGRALPERIAAEAVSADCKLADLIEKNNKREKLRIAAINYADEQYGKIKKDFTPSFVGRLLLMVAQAEDKADLDKRVASIKTDNKREKAKTFIDSAEKQYSSEWREFLKIALTVIKYRLKEAGGNE